MPKQPLAIQTIKLIEADYLANVEALAVIAARHGLNIRDIARLRQQYDWPPRSAKAGRQVPVAEPVVSKPKKPAAAKPQETKAVRRVKKNIVQRLYQAIDSKLNQLEISMASEEQPSPADSERETRAIGTLIRNIEKVADLETDLTRSGSGDPKSVGGLYSGEEADRRRRALAERLEKIRERHRGAGGAGSRGAAGGDKD